MASAAGIKLGGVFVEIGADPRKFFAAYNSVQKSLGNLGKNLMSGGGRLAAAGIGMSAPIVAAVRQGANFESTLLNIKASTGATATEIDKIKASAMGMSEALGVGPTAAAQGMLELLKAGMSLDAVLGGAGKAAIEFAKVGEMDVANAAVVMNDAMNVFGVSGEKAANTLSAAADASSTSIAQMAEAFSMSSAVAGKAGLPIDDLSAALAILANNGVKGSDAGTSVKTMLMRLMAPASDAADAMAGVGLSVRDFVNQDTGKMLPLAEVIGKLNDAMGPLDAVAKRQVLAKIFGADAIRAALILGDVGPAGFDDIQKAMSSALPVSAKFATLMSGLSGMGEKVLSALKRLAIAISDAVSPALAAVGPVLVGFVNGLTNLVRANPEAVAGLAKMAVAAIGVGGAMIGAGAGLRVVAFGMGSIAKAAALVVSPIALVAKTAIGIGSSFASAVPGIVSLSGHFGKLLISTAAFAAGAAASAASYVGSLATITAATAARMAFVSATWLATGIAVSAGFIAHIKAMVTYYTGALAGIQAITISRAGATAAAWILSAAGVDTFSNSVKASLASANRVVNSTLATVGPALSFIARGLSAVISDVSRLAGPLARPFVDATRSVTGFATATASGIGSYVASVASAVTASVTGAARIAQAWLSQAAGAVGQFVSGALAPIATYIASVGAAAAATLASTARIAGAWLVSTFPAISAFVVSSTAGIAKYIASTVAAAVASVTNAARSGAAWVASGMPGVLTFVGSAVAGLARYLAAAAAAVAGSVASAAAVAAAWLAPLAPFAALAAAIGGAGVLAYRFKDQIGSALSGVGDLAGQAGSAIAGTFSVVLADATVVFSDLYGTATTTFTGIYDAIAAGDLSGAMDVLWAGLTAGWLRGTEALMSYVDPWLAMFQNSFTIMGAELYKAWDGLWVNVSNSLNTAGAVLMGAMDNIINPILASWDFLEASIRKAWIRISGIFKDGEAKRVELAKVDKEMKDRADKRAVERPGVKGRLAKAAMQNADANTQLEQRRAAVDTNTQATIDARQAALATDAAARRQATLDAEARLKGMVSGQADARIETQARSGQVDDLLAAIRGATSVDQLAGVGGLGDQFNTLRDLGRLTTEQEGAISDALDKAAEGLTRTATASAASAEGGPSVTPPDVSSKVTAAGTFSSLNLGQMFGGTSLAERTAKAAEETAKNTRKIDDGGKVAA